jgi:hypothetical protein
MKTKYSQALIEYKQSNDYLSSVKEMKAKGMKQPYIDNILESAFSAGFNSNA